MACREHSGVRGSLPPVDGDEARCGAEAGPAFTRRSVLGAAVAVPLAAGLCGGPLVAEAAPVADVALILPFPIEAEGSWAGLFRRFQRIDLARERFQEASSARAYGPGRRPFAEQEALDARFGEVVEVADEAMLALLEAPSPDLEALAFKISLISDHLVWELEGGEECMVWLEADARRLAGRFKPVAHVPGPDR
jgi:hypothetical protein